MKKFLCLCAVLAMSASLSFAEDPQPLEIEGVAIELQQTMGVGANFSDGVITWSGGVDGWLMSEAGDFAFFSAMPGFQSAPVSATFSLITDLSAGGLAKARFASGLWSMGIIVDGIGSVANLSGHVSGNYNEMETGVNTDALEGRAVVIVDTATFNDAYWQALIGTPICWEGTGQAAGIIANISLPENAGIQDYQTDYHSSNVIVTLYADESAVPEPATMALLVLGGLLLRKRS